MAELRELAFKRSVSCKRQTQEQVRAFVIGSLEKQESLKRLVYEEVVFELLSIIPPEYEYLQSLINAYSDEIAGYYDPDEDVYIMVEDLSRHKENLIMTHELEHALQDQHFSVEDVLDNSFPNDVLLARAALLEGDANVLMKQHHGVADCFSLLSESALSVMQKKIETSFHPSLPRSLALMMDFPYIYGERFVCTLLQRGGYSAVNRAFEHYPISTTEIMHPLLYPVRAKQFAVEPGEFFWKARKRFGAALYEDTLGEFGILSMFARFFSLEQAAELASGWRGDRLWLFEAEEDEWTLLWQLQWEDEAKALSFVQALKAQALRGARVEQEGVRVLVEIES